MISTVLQVVGVLGMLAVGLALIGWAAWLPVAYVRTVRHELREDRRAFWQAHPEWPRR